MEASVTSPSGVTEMCDIQDLGTSQYSIKFIPKEMGIHTVSVKHRGMHIPGSFFVVFTGQRLRSATIDVYAPSAALSSQTGPANSLGRSPNPR